MSAVGIRCHCPRCAGSVTFARISDYLNAHQLPVSEYVLDSEVELEEAVSRHPSGRYVGTFEDGSQVLVEEVAPGALVVATRSSSSATWGVPSPLEVAP